MTHQFSYRSNGFHCHYTLTKVPDPSEFLAQAHDEFEILYFINGEGSFLVEGTDYKLSAGDVVILRTSEMHKLSISPDKPYERFALHFFPMAADIFGNGQSLLLPFRERRLGTLNVYHKEDFPSDMYALCLREMYAPIGSSIERSTVVLACLAAFLVQLNSAFAVKAENNEQPPDIRQTEMIDYVNRHLYEDISLHSISEHFFLSEAHMNRIFRAATGSTVWDYVKMKRLLAARELIKMGEGPVVVARKCGFNDYSSFYRAYMKHFGSAPKGDISKQ